MDSNFSSEMMETIWKQRVQAFDTMWFILQAIAALYSSSLAFMHRPVDFLRCRSHVHLLCSPYKNERKHVTLYPVALHKHHEDPLKFVSSFNDCTIYGQPLNAEFVKPTDCNQLAATIVQFQIIFLPRSRWVIVDGDRSRPAISRYWDK
jgi:hypothetical protein